MIPQLDPEKRLFFKGCYPYEIYYFSDKKFILSPSIENLILR